MKIPAHLHAFDIHPRDQSFLACAVCGFSVPASALTSRVNLDAWTARQHCTARVLEHLHIDREGRSTAPTEVQS